MKSVRYTLVICPMIGMVALGCSAPNLDVRGRTFEDANVAVWNYREAVEVYDYIKVYSYLESDQRGALEELFYWLEQYHRPELARWAYERLPKERYMVASFFAGIGPLRTGLGSPKSLSRKDMLAIRICDSRRFQVKYRSDVGSWTIDPNIEFVLGPSGSAGSIKLLHYWAQEGEHGDRARKEMISGIRKAIRAQNRLIRKARR